MVRKKIGRPPADWVRQLSELKKKDDEYLDYHDLCKLFDVSLRSMHGFCTKNKIKGEYYKHETNVVRKRFRVKDLKKAAALYLKNWS